MYDTLGLHWESCNLFWDPAKNKKGGITQTKKRDPGATGIYLNCLRSNITVIDIDGDTPESRALLSLLRGRCNMVAITRKGVHLVFRHTDKLPGQHANPKTKIDVRSHADGKSGIILVQPSRYTVPGEAPTKYAWLVTPDGSGLQDVLKKSSRS
jgi:hypothetical protein